MTLKTKYKLLSTTLAATLVATIANTSNKAYAEEAVTLEEIVVTAQKRSENLQEVPLPWHLTCLPLQSGTRNRWACALTAHFV